MMMMVVVVVVMVFFVLWCQASKAILESFAHLAIP
jgi:hypothetical protein